MPVTILGIESSCDDTGAAVLIDRQIISNCIANQSVHAQYGGVVPELASRAHQANIIPVVEAALKKADITLHELDAIAFTRGPGLMGSLMVGLSYAKGAALALDIPLIAVQHMQAHILSHFIEEPCPQFPFLCLTVSGGHTQIVLVRSASDMDILGQTIDDAAGEAFDKAAKMLGLPYPGGPLIDKYAQEGSPDRFSFAEPQVQGLDFSFSGLKTSILYFLQARQKEDANFIHNNMPDLCAGIQSTIVRILLKKMKQASEITGIKQLAVAGGVSANSGLRRQFEDAALKYGWEIFIPKPQFCTDNAAMIAMAGYFKFLNADFVQQDVTPLARIPFLT